MKSKNCKRYSIPCVLYPVICLLALTVGCETGDVKPSPADKIAVLKKEKKQLAHKVEQVQVENKQLTKQLEVLSGLSEEGLDNLYNLQTIKIGRYTNLYDKDKDGKEEKLIVYIQPTDQDGDVVKAAGAVDVQLWNLNNNNGQALLGKWRVEPDELRKMWFATIVTINYRLTFDVADKVENFEEPLTVKVTFTDYVTGKVFKQQTVIKP